MNKPIEEADARHASFLTREVPSGSAAGLVHQGLKTDHKPRWRDEYGNPKYIDHREPFELFGKRYCWTLFDKDWNMTDTLHLVPYEAYRDVIQRNLRLATLQGLA